jgi:hypothetical protein
MPNGAGKAPPNYDTVGVLHDLHSVLTVVPAGALRPPHLGPGGPDALERRLVRMHNFQPVFSREMLKHHGEFESFRLHFLRKKRLHGSNTARHLQVDLQRLLDGPLGDHLQLRHAPLDLHCRHHGVLEHLSFEDHPKGLLHFSQSARALFAGRCDEAGEDSGLRHQAVDRRPVPPQPLSDLLR